MIDAGSDEGMDQRIFYLTGDLTIKDAAGLKADLEKELGLCSRLLIDCGSLTGIDVSTLQLLCSLHRSTLMTGQSLGLTGNTPEVLSAAIKESGYLRHRGCTNDPAVACLWKEESHG